jgi:Protein of unknown function (DUF3179)
VVRWLAPQLRLLPNEDIKWAAWREAHPDGKVLSSATGHRRDYDHDAYAGYARSSETVFPVRWTRSDLGKKDWVIGVIVNGQAKAYPLDDLKKETRVQDNIAGAQIEIAYEPARRSAEIIDKQNGQPIPFTVAYWFAWQAFYPSTELFRH